jgi:ParB family transcriptional regulator, chromosome partitioning protein
MNNRNRGLGRGLSALMGEMQPAAGAAPTQGPTRTRGEILMPIEMISPNPEQPRRHFAAENLADLAASIREKGVLQPLIVREKPAGSGQYEIVAGERRWRAAQMAQRHDVPVLIREFTDTEALEVAIIENIQRADLSPVEEAQGYRALMDRFGHTQEKLAEALGKSRSHIANLLRLLTLPEPVLEHMRDGRLSAGHARALIGHPDAESVAAQVIEKGLSVREVEGLARGGAEPKAQAKPRPSRGSEKSADTRALEDELSANLGMKVALDHREGEESGTLTIRFASLEQLDDLCRVLTVTPLAGSR